MKLPDDPSSNLFKKIISLKSIESLYFVVFVFLFLSIVNFVLDDNPKEFSDKIVQKNHQITTQK